MTELVEDKFLDGKVLLAQPVKGYRAAMDPVLLAAAVPAAKRVLDLGCGVGAALYCYGWRVSDASLTGLELDPETADIARENAARNRFQDRVQIVTGSILAPPKALSEGGFDCVFANPPFQEAHAGDASPIEGRARSNTEGEAKLSDWVKAMLRATRPKGTLAMIHRADRVDEIVRHMVGKAGEITIIPLWPRQEMQAKRVIVRARKGVKGGAILHPGLVLHGEGDTRYTPEAQAILRDGAALL